MGKNDDYKFEVDWEDDMGLTQYQNLALRTANNTLAPRDRIINGVMGLNGEAGELIDIVKKHMFQGHKLATDKLIDELSDVLWYCALLADGLGMDLADIARFNVSKLKARYPEGFSAERSINREEYL